MALRLIYMTFTRVLGWMVLLPRSSSAKEAEIRSCATNSLYFSGVLRDPG